MGNGVTGGMGYGPHGQWVQEVWSTWAMVTHGAVGYRVWGTVGISHMGNGAHGTKGYRGMGYRGMGNRGIWGNRVQGYGVQDTWAMGTGVWATRQ